MHVTIGLSLLAGLASFLTPCVLSLVPAYIGYLSGQSATLKSNKGTLRTFIHGLVFVAGFSLVFILFGIAAAFLGGLLRDIRTWLTRIGGIVVILFGLHMTGILRLKFLEYDARLQTNSKRELGLASSFLMGISFSAGWSPCIGPVLGAILALALQEGSIINGILYLSAYSMGMAIPFLLAALAIGWVSKILQRYGKFMHIVEIFMGIILIILGLLLFFGVYERMARLGTIINLGL
jgi:cytochrome c-type biogenesis protein